jgi:hypothetical protein
MTKEQKREQIIELKQKAIEIQKQWQFPNEHYIEATGMIMAYDAILALQPEQPIEQSIDINTPFFGNTGAEIPMMQSEISCEKCALFQIWNPEKEGERDPDWGRVFREQSESKTAEEILEWCKRRMPYSGPSESPQLWAERRVFEAKMIQEYIKAMEEYRQQPKKDERSLIIQFLAESTWIKLPEGKDCIDIADEWINLQKK